MFVSTKFFIPYPDWHKSEGLWKHHWAGTGGPRDCRKAISWTRLHLYPEEPVPCSVRLCERKEQEMLTCITLTETFSIISLIIKCDFNLNPLLILRSHIDYWSKKIAYKQRNRCSDRKTELFTRWCIQACSNYCIRPSQCSRVLKKHRDISDLQHPHQW